MARGIAFGSIPVCRVPEGSATAPSLCPPAPPPLTHPPDTDPLPPVLSPCTCGPPNPLKAVLEDWLVRHMKPCTLMLGIA